MEATATKSPDLTGFSREAVEAALEPVREEFAMDLGLCFPDLSSSSATENSVFWARCVLQQGLYAVTAVICPSSLLAWWLAPASFALGSRDQIPIDAYYYF